MSIWHSGFCAVCWVVMPIFILSACALKSSRPNMLQPVVLPQVSGNVARYRFEMTQNGQRMTADQFDAWMQANGIHIVKKGVGYANIATAYNSPWRFSTIGGVRLLCWLVMLKSHK